jgi:uncharacterized Zn finger protein
MVEIMVRCEGCGEEYSARIVIKGSRDVTFKGNQARCPHCGRWNPIDDRKIKKS